MNYVVERLRPVDVEAMAKLHTAVFTEVFTNYPFELDKGYVKERMAKKYTPSEIEIIKAATLTDEAAAELIWFIAKNEEGEVVGFARPYRQDDEGLQRLGALYVDKDHRGKGVADLLMRRAIDWSLSGKPLYLWVTEDNKRARRFYEKWDFHPVNGKRKIIYEKIPHIQMKRNKEEI